MLLTPRKSRDTRASEFLRKSRDHANAVSRYAFNRFCARRARDNNTEFDAIDLAVSVIFTRARDLLLVGLFVNLLAT